MMLDDRTLRYLSTVARAGSLRAAARELGVAPSAVQRTLAAAERRVGCPLFERGPEGARPTEAGRVVVQHAQEREDLDVHLAARLSRVTAAAEGGVTVALGLGFVEDFATRVLPGFMRKHPRVLVRIVTGGTGEVVATLLRDDADLAVALHPAPDRRLRVVRGTPQPVGLACAPGQSLAAGGSESITPSALAGERMAVLPQGFGLRALHDDVLRAHAVEVDVVMESDSQPAIVAAVAAGQVVALLPPVTVKRAVEAEVVRLVPVDDAHLSRVRAALLTRTGRRLSPAAVALLSSCQAWFDPEVLL
ncbi:LysR family transcriptional regulator [Ornithinimicrobium pratense]|uniref:LysR family transcriptional regulator n=1 Tax=Ornithinimicrobium pratense TaxID=2593973 RepID=A0A5J6V444_9MICO|nr:LysR family transcriptional regulator [Ornithinimicrobium pratense]QFG68488.1 LysR family transcriptional regulator [Ornithinimicrobium pratense]